MSAEFPTLADIADAHAAVHADGCGCSGITETAGAHISAMWDYSRTIRTVDQLDALPVGAVVMPLWCELNPPLPLTRYSDGWFGFPGQRPYHPLGSGSRYETALLLWHPDWAQS